MEANEPEPKERHPAGPLKRHFQHRKGRAEDPRRDILNSPQKRLRSLLERSSHSEGGRLHRLPLRRLYPVRRSCIGHLGRGLHQKTLGLSRRNTRGQFLWHRGDGL